MRDETDLEMMRALLGDASNDEMRAHRERMLRDQAYRAKFDVLQQTAADLRELPAPGLAPGFEARVMNAVGTDVRSDARGHLRGAIRGEMRGVMRSVMREEESIGEVMGRQFWRIAAPAMLAAAAALFVLVERDGVATSKADTVTTQPTVAASQSSPLSQSTQPSLAAWYPISSDPTDMLTRN